MSLKRDSSTKSSGEEHKNKTGWKRSSSKGSTSSEGKLKKLSKDSLSEDGSYGSRNESNDEKSRYLHIIRTWRAKHDLAKAMSNKYLEEKEELEKDLLDMTNEKKRVEEDFDNLKVKSREKVEELEFITKKVRKDAKDEVDSINAEFTKYQEEMKSSIKFYKERDENMSKELSTVKEAAENDKKSYELQLQQSSMVKPDVLEESLQEIEKWKRKYDEDMKRIALKKTKREELRKANARLINSEESKRNEETIIRLENLIKTQNRRSSESLEKQYLFQENVIKAINELKEFRHRCQELYRLTAKKAPEVQHLLPCNQNNSSSRLNASNSTTTDAFLMKLKKLENCRRKIENLENSTSGEDLLETNASLLFFEIRHAINTAELYRMMHNTQVKLKTSLDADDIRSSKRIKNKVEMVSQSLNAGSTMPNRWAMKVSELKTAKNFLSKDIIIPADDKENTISEVEVSNQSNESVQNILPSKLNTSETDMAFIQNMEKILLRKAHTERKSLALKKVNATNLIQDEHTNDTKPETETPVAKIHRNTVKDAVSDEFRLKMGEIFRQRLQPQDENRSPAQKVSEAEVKTEEKVDVAEGNHTSDENRQIELKKKEPSKFLKQVENILEKQRQDFTEATSTRPKESSDKNNEINVNPIKTPGATLSIHSSQEFLSKMQMILEKQRKAINGEEQDATVANDDTNDLPMQNTVNSVDRDNVDEVNTLPLHPPIDNIAKPETVENTNNHTTHSSSTQRSNKKVSKLWRTLFSSASRKKSNVNNQVKHASLDASSTYINNQQSSKKSVKDSHLADDLENNGSSHQSSHVSIARSLPDLIQGMERTEF